ncbi:MAG TPA: hypothetical protein P5114_03030 [Hyphomicrobiaceae bacterium]|nr:hypothetical protein [Hyphomicrobiaceae bacterium]
MTRIFRATTKTGQNLVYCVADGRRGEQALRELERQCEGGTITTVPHDDALAAKVVHIDNPQKARPAGPARNTQTQDK